MKRVVYLFILGLLMVGVGIFMWVAPTNFINILALLFSVYLIFDGLKSLYTLFSIRRKVDSSSIKWTLFIKALINVIIGVAAITITFMRPSAILNIIVYLIAADFFASGLVDLYECLMLKRLKLYTGSLALETALAFVFGVLFCLFPGFIGKTGLIILAVLVIIAGVITVSSAVHALIMVRTLKKYGISMDSSKAVDAEFTEENKN